MTKSSMRTISIGLVAITIGFALSLTNWLKPSAKGQSATPESTTFWLQPGDKIQVLGADQQQLGGKTQTYIVRRRLPDHFVEVETPEKQAAYLNLGQALFIT